MRTAALLVLVAVTASACSNPPSTGSDRVLVIATTSVVGDLVAQVAGPDADVEVLLPVGADPHDFQPSSRQVAMLREADLVVAVGLGLEEGLEDALDAAAADGVRVLELGPAVDPRPFGEHATDDHDEEDHDGEEDRHDGDDPHVWMDPIRMIDAAARIADELQAVRAGAWSQRAGDYADRLRTLDTEIRTLVEALKPHQRILVTNHDALGYFADRYGFEVVGVIVPGGSTLAEPSSAELAALVQTIRERSVPAIFAETTEPSTLANAIAAEAGDAVAVVELYTGSLGPSGSGAETLIDLLRFDARAIVEALS